MKRAFACAAILPAAAAHAHPVRVVDDRGVAIRLERPAERIVGKIYFVDPDLSLGQGPRLAEGAREPCRELEFARN